MHRSHRFGLAIGLALLLASTTSVSAQPLGSLIRELFGTVVLDNPEHDAHFAAEEQLDSVSDTFNSSIAPQLTTFPLGSPGGGFTFTYDDTLKTFSRASESFGSLFGERALTIGDGKWNFGFSVLASEYDNLNDLDLQSGQVEFQLLHQDAEGDGLLDPFFEGDTITSSMSISLETQTAIFFATYGVTDRFDFGVAIPYVETDLEVAADLTVNRLSTSSPNFEAVHGFDINDPNLEVTSRDRAVARRGGSASGVGDILLRGKYRFRESGTGGLAGAVDVRLPTGDDEDLLGTGGTQVKAFLIGSRELGRVSPHFNVGYTLSNSGGTVIRDLPDEFNLAVGLGVAASPQVTLAFDLVGRRLLDAVVTNSVSEDFLFTPGPGGGTESITLNNIVTAKEDVDLALGSAGIRFNPTGSLLVSLNVLFSLTDDGLQDEDVIPVVSIDYSR